MKNIEKIFGIGIVTILLISGMGVVSACDSPLLASRDYINVGNVEARVKMSQETLIITYTTTGDWIITETHLGVASSLSGIPQNKGGNPKIGQFAKKTAAGLPVEIHDTEVIYKIDLNKIEGLESGDGGTIYIAAHAVVYNTASCVEETAWGDTGFSFPGSSWALYFTFEVPPWT